MFRHLYSYCLLAWRLIRTCFQTPTPLFCLSDILSILRWFSFNFSCFNCGFYWFYLFSFPFSITSTKLNTMPTSLFHRFSSHIEQLWLPLREAIWHAFLHREIFNDGQEVRDNVTNSMFSLSEFRILSLVRFIFIFWKLFISQNVRSINIKKCILCLILLKNSSTLRAFLLSTACTRVAQACWVMGDFIVPPPL